MNRIYFIFKNAMSYWYYLVAGLIFTAFYSIFSGLNVTLIKPMLDYIFVQRTQQNIYHTFGEFLSISAESFSNFFHNFSFNIFSLSFKTFKPLIDENEQIWQTTDQFVLLKFLCIAVFLLFLIKNLLYFFERYSLIIFRGNAVRSLRNKLFAKYLTRSLDFFHKNNVGDSLVRLVNDVSIINKQLIMSIFNIIRNSFTIIILVRIAIYFDTKLFLLSIVIVPIFTISIGLLGKKIKKYAKRLQSGTSSMFSNVEEVLNNIRIVKAFTKEDFEISKFNKITKKYLNAWSKSRIYANLNVPISEMNGVITGIIVLMIGGTKVLQFDSGLSFGDFMAFLFAIFSILHPLKEMTKAYSSIKKALVSLDRVFEILENKNSIYEIKNPIKKLSFENKIQFNNINFHYNPETAVLKNINFSISKGEKIALVGSSGSGKTTIINLLSRMYDPIKGEILIDSIPIRNIQISDYRSLFGTVTQDSYLFSDSIKANIGYGSHKIVDSKMVEDASKIAFADDFINKMPEKYNEKLLSKGSNLSGGQKQRICIARAIISNPPIIIFDEATSALDSESEFKVQQAIEKATENRTVIMIAHRLSTVLSSDKIIVLDKGKIVGMGKHKELLSSCEKYKELYNLQFEVHIKS